MNTKHPETSQIIEKLSLFKRDGLIQSQQEIIKEELQQLQITNKEEPLLQVLKVLRENSFQDILGYFANHRKNGIYATIDDEYKVQDILFCILRPILPDLQYENPLGKNRGALTSTRIDLVSASTGMFIEAKFANANHVAKKIESEISEDMIKYSKSGLFRYLIFFIYCANYNFPNAVDFANDHTRMLRLDDINVQTYCIIKP